MGMTARYGVKMRALAALVLLAYPTPAAAECSADGTGCEDGGGNCIMPLVTCSANADCPGEQWCGSECPGGGDHCREPNCISRTSAEHSCEGSTEPFIGQRYAGIAIYLIGGLFSICSCCGMVFCVFYQHKLTTARHAREAQERAARAAAGAEMQPAIAVAVPVMAPPVAVAVAVPVSAA